jgi:hypothetical protein
MAFGKLTSLIISPNDGSGIEVGGLDFGFSIQRSNKFIDNTAEFNIAGMNPTTRDLFFKRGSSVQFSAGWEDQMNGVLTTMFVGVITEMKSSKNKEGDSILNIQAATCRAPNKTLEQTWVSLGYSPDLETGSTIPLNRVIKDIVAQLGFNLIGDALSDKIVLPNGFHYVGRMRGALRFIEQVLLANQMTFHVENTDFIILDFNGNGISRSAILGYDSGLLYCRPMETYIQKLPYTKGKKGQPPQIDLKKIEIAAPKGFVEFGCIFHPQVLPNSVLTISSEEFMGTAVVETVRFFGDNGEGEFNMEGTAGYHGGEVQTDDIRTGTDETQIA